MNEQTQNTQPEAPKKRGRPPANRDPQPTATATPHTDQRRERNERVAIATQGEGRKKRVGLTQKGLLGMPASVEIEEGMHYCWARDDEKGNLQRYLNADYTPALNRSQKKEMRHSGDNKDMLVLMKIEERYYQEDYEKEQSRIIGREATLGQSEYLPGGVRKVLSRNTY